MSLSIYDLAKLPQDEIEGYFKELDDEQVYALSTDWQFLARHDQRQPAELGSNGKFIWMMCAGRGAGKTRTFAEWINHKVQYEGYRYPTLIGATASEVRDIMIEGESGILACAQPDFEPHFFPGKRHVEWPNGVTAKILYGSEPERARGPQSDIIWCDEIAKWQYPDKTFTNAMLGLRLGASPLCGISTTPKPIPIIKKIIKRDESIVTKASTYDNRDNLSEVFIKTIIGEYEGTRLGRQELWAEVLEDNPNALWRRGWIEAARIGSVEELPGYDADEAPYGAMEQIVVAVDPAVTSGEESSDTGIVVMGRGSAPKKNGNGVRPQRTEYSHYYVFADLTIHGTPDQWGKRVIYAFNLYGADMVIGEVNNGGDLVESNIRKQPGGENIPFRAVRASRGKAIRAEPVSSLYEQCVAEGTIIKTKFGERRIEDIHIGDYVWTRHGPKRVYWAGMTGIKPTIKIRTKLRDLICTTNHPIYTQKGFVQAGQLVPNNDMITIWDHINAKIVMKQYSVKMSDVEAVLQKNDGKRENQNVNMSYFKALDTTYKMMDIGEAAGMQEINFFIGQSGNQSMVPSRQETIYITSTGIPAIMTSKISLISQLRYIPLNTILIRNTQKKYSIEYLELKKNGGNNGKQMSIFARNAELNSKQKRRVCDSVLQPVIRDIGIDAVEKHRTIPVYNLGVEDVPEYFANGFLVHNCRVHHLGHFAELEEQLTEWEPGDESPDRLDAAVWAGTYLAGFGDGTVVGQVDPEELGL